MTRSHRLLKNSLPAATTKAENRSDALDTGRRTLLLGLNAWVIMAVWPLVVASPTSLERAAMVLAAALPLLVLLGLPWPRRDARLDLLVACCTLLIFPVALVCGLATLDAARAEAVLDTGWLLIAAAALLAYGYSAAVDCSPREVPRKVRLTPLAAADDLIEAHHAPARAALRRVAIAIFLAGSVGLGLIAPSWGGVGALRSSWGGAATDAALLLSVICGALAVTTVALFMGKALRRDDGGALDRRRLPARIVRRLATALLGLLAYYALR